MNMFIRVATVLALVAFLDPTTLTGQGKIRVAIGYLENNSERSWWFHDDMGPAARNHIDNAFFENEQLSSMFSVIEREKLDMVLQEQGLATSGALDQQTAAKVGQILGIKYIITGGIDKFAINTTKGGFRGIGGSYTKADATISMRLIDTTTAERVISVKAAGDVKKGGAFGLGANLSRKNEWGIASEAIEKAALEVVKKFSANRGLQKLSPDITMSGMEGKIIKVDGNRAWINMGGMSGIQPGDQYTVISVGEALIDPDTGQVLGQEETLTGKGQIVEVKERFSIMTFTGSAAAKDVVRRK